MEARKDSSDVEQDAADTTAFRLAPAPETMVPTYYLVDLAKNADTLRLLFEREEAPVYDLPYLHSRERDIAYNGPLLIDPVTEDCRDWLDTWVDQGKAVAIHAEHRALQAVRQHLIGLNRVQTPHGSSLFRYADPATFASVGPSLNSAQRLRILGPLSAISGHYVGQNWCLSACQREHKSRNDEEAPLRLSQKNLDFVIRYRLKLLATALAESNDLAPDLVSDWFRQLTDLGAPSEQGLVESSELLISQGLTRPLDDMETAQIRQAGNRWSDKLNAIARMAYQEGT